MTQRCVLVFTALVFALPGLAQTAAQTPDQGSDPKQSFVSALGLGSGATLAVTQKGTAVSASVERQVSSPSVNFWQIGLSGATDKNGQAEVFSSHDADAPGFKGKLGIGRSSFIKKRPLYTASGGAFLLEAWCRDLLTVVNNTLPAPATIPQDASCKAAVPLVMSALEKSQLAGAAKPDAKTAALDELVLTKLAAVDSDLTVDSQARLCAALKAEPAVYQLCPDSGKPIKSVEDQGKVYPGLYSGMVFGQPAKFNWKVWGSWAPTLTSVDYRPVSNGVANLATKQQWTRLLNTGVGDVALYYGNVAFGMEGGFGQTVQVKTQNVCNTTTSGTYTAQLCDMAMVGQPNPMNTWIGSATLGVTPLPILGKGTLLKPGAQIVFSYVAPVAGGHSSEVAVPFYFAPSISPMSFVFGIQPTWDWNTDPKVGNKFSVSLFVGARPEITK